MCCFGDSRGGSVDPAIMGADKIKGLKVREAMPPKVGQEVAYEDIWKDQTCVIVFFRRFG